MALTVGDIRKALSKYSDDTLVVGEFGDDFSPFTTTCPLKSKGALSIKNVNKTSLDNKTWYKADLNNKKVISISYNPKYSNEFWAEPEDASPYWKPKIDADVQERIRKWKPIEQCFHGPVFY